VTKSWRRKINKLILKTKINFSWSRFVTYFYCDLRVANFFNSNDRVIYSNSPIKCDLKVKTDFFLFFKCLYQTSHAWIDLLWLCVKIKPFKIFASHDRLQFKQKQSRTVTKASKWTFRLSKHFEYLKIKLNTMSFGIL